MILYSALATDQVMVGQLLTSQGVVICVSQSEWSRGQLNIARLSMSYMAQRSFQR